MATTNIELASTYTLITSETDFVAQNRYHTGQEWVRSAGVPDESLRGVYIESYNGIDGSMGSGDLYGKGAGLVVVLS